MLRERAIIVLLGAPGQGKSWLTRFLIAKWQKEFSRANPDWTKGNRDRKPPVIICDPNRGFEEGEFKPGGAEDYKLLYPWIREITGNGDGPGVSTRVGMEGALLVLDDADAYIQNTNTNNPWRPLWLKNRHLRLDIVISAHRPQGIPKEMIAAAQQLWLFAMEEPNAIDYLRTIPALANFDADLPDTAGRALFVSLRPRKAPRILKLFDPQDRKISRKDRR